jgi:hypothetical protein
VCLLKRFSVAQTYPHTVIYKPLIVRSRNEVLSQILSSTLIPMFSTIEVNLETLVEGSIITLRVFLSRKFSVDLAQAEFIIAFIHLILSFQDNFSKSQAIQPGQNSMKPPKTIRNHIQGQSVELDNMTVAKATVTEDISPILDVHMYNSKSS